MAYATVPKQKKTKSWKDGWKLMGWSSKDAMEGYKLKKSKDGKPYWAKGWSFKDTGWSNGTKKSASPKSKQHWSEGYSGALKGYKLKPTKKEENKK